MPAFPEGTLFYPCVTQDGVMPSFGRLPEAPEGHKFEDGGSGLMVGDIEMVPRWAKPAGLQYYIVKDGFADDEFRDVEKAFREAADEWSGLDFGVHLKQTPDRTKANFLIKHFIPSKADDRTLASAFFPSDKDREVLVYRATLVDESWRKLLKNTFLHEIGHILGLRHEFANDPDPDPKRAGQNRESLAHLFGSVNPHSVMSYDVPPQINDLDKKDVVGFYRLLNGTKIDGVPVVDFVPEPFP
ncbi:hypothetical protein QBC47DRAFT_412001 [Echria macrotheca]|uniref:Peptidase M10 metallopeptidase domain-containing protein n=1 Tax=Echria macrotheca TaxID=438768 RepID=A0AAJ0F7G2_9PEZI|nr:hypothetical protein QBC47DRAFT_412001 [Echria macrotheca]